MGSARLFPLLLVLSAPGVAKDAETAAEARVSIDAREASAREVVAVLAEAGRLQVVFDPGTSCALTLKVQRITWREALDTVLRACRLGFEESGSVIRVAPIGRIRGEAEDRRRLAEERRLTPSGTVAGFRLSYARAAEVAPLLKRLLPRGEVHFDARTNTLFVVD
jgi:type IV pilus assembly protein PilQ